MFQIRSATAPFCGQCGHANRAITSGRCLICSCQEPSHKVSPPVYASLLRRSRPPRGRVGNIFGLTGPVPPNTFTVAAALAGVVFLARWVSGDATGLSLLWLVVSAGLLWLAYRN